jgi:predicted transcriptional regulator
MGLGMKITLTDREAEYLDVLWELGPSTVTEVRERLAGDPAYTTVLTILRKMESKGYVEAQKDGRAHRYAALVERDTARRSALRELSTKLFKGSAELLMAHLISDDSLSDEQIKRIRSMLDKQKNNNKE